MLINPNTGSNEFEDFEIDRSLDSAKFRKETGFQPITWREMIRKMANDNDYTNIEI